MLSWECHLLFGHAVLEVLGRKHGTGIPTLKRMSGGPLGRLVDACRVQAFARGVVVEFHPELLGPLA